MILDYLMHLMWLPSELQQVTRWLIRVTPDILVGLHQPVAMLWFRPMSFFFALLSYINFKHDSEIAVIHDQPTRTSTV